ncbi:hypothetical protein CYR40_09605 [Chimaeribacter arupi]|uniref:hypothetical protein n=1 Tax=Chimaeribacter arupi TaxID=2060066 RepID=UPI000C7B5B8D|nr:hypothetical protein [Chimaeribacter arupi]PLR46939.1 hypothetical protein CYR40_09605 [Chimaeribacter arupi]
MNMTIATLNQGISHGLTPLFIGRFLPKTAAPYPELIRLENWQDFSDRFLGENEQDLLKSELQQLPVMVSVQKGGQRIHEVLNPYTLFIRQAILLWQDNSLRLTHTEEELMERVVGTEMLLPENLACRAALLSQMSDGALGSYYALRHYFELGGGACYLLSAERSTPSFLSDVLAEGGFPPEIRMICSLVDHPYSINLQAVLSANVPLYASYPLITDETAWLPAGNELCIFDPRDEQLVTLFMLTGDDADLVPLTLAELRIQHPELADQVCEQLSPVLLPVVLPASIANISNAGTQRLQINAEAISPLSLPAYPVPA